VVNERVRRKAEYYQYGPYDRRRPSGVIHLRWMRRRGLIGRMNNLIITGNCVAELGFSSRAFYPSYRSYQSDPSNACFAYNHGEING
jgi:hypothetical protein